MNEKELKEYQEKLMSGAKGTMKLGIVTGVGQGVIGGMSAGIPGSAPAAGAIGGALNLAAVGNMAAVGMSILPGQKSKTKKTEKKKKGTPMTNPSNFF